MKKIEGVDFTNFQVLRLKKEIDVMVIRISEKLYKENERLKTKIEQLEKENAILLKRTAILDQYKPVKNENA